jgi:hypothetical protein
MAMSELYFIECAESCSRLAHQESDPGMRHMLHHLANEYRLKAIHVRNRERSTPSLHAGLALSAQTHAFPQAMTKR